MALPVNIGAAQVAAGPVILVAMSARILDPVVVLLLRLRPKVREDADTMELMDPRRGSFSFALLGCAADNQLSSFAWAARGSGMMISARRSWRGILLIEAMLPASEPAVLLIRERVILLEERLAMEADRVSGAKLVPPSSSNGSGAELGKDDAGRLRRYSTMRVCEIDKCCKRLCHCVG